MNVNPVTGSQYASQVSASGSQQARQAPPPPPPGPPPGEGGFVNAIGSALESLGVTDVAASDKDSAASALGTFLQQLMSSLHGQGEADSASQVETVDAVGQGTRGERGGPGGAGGPGRLAQDLKALASSLQGSASGNSSTSSLQASFSSLLDSLGADSSDSGSKLASFLQTLADKLPQAGSSGNLVNTSA